jgi:hypothetical protein
MALCSPLAFLRQKRFRFGVAFGLFALAFGVGAPLCAEPFLFPWDPPARREPEKTGLTAPQIRAILAREGASMIGSPRPRGGETIVLGRDRDGGRKKFTLDAASGAVLKVELIARPEKDAGGNQERRRANGGDLAAPGRPLPPPQHATDGADGDPLGAPPVDAAINPARPGALAPAPQAPAKNPESADSALSPIRPIRPPGGPRVEPLPQ